MTDTQSEDARQYKAPISESTTLKFVIGSWFLYDSFRYCTQLRTVTSPFQKVTRQVTGFAHALSGKPMKINEVDVEKPFQSEDEWMHYATGLRVGNIRTVERIVTFPFVHQSPGYVEGEPMATRDALIQMSEYGYELHAVCHSHPGRGMNATHPSGIDLDHQERLERGGYAVVSCIYSRDGFARFFSVGFPFQIETYGQGVEHCGENIFHLTGS